MKFIDLDRQYEIIGNEIDERIKNVIKEKDFIMGSEINELELELKKYVGRKYAITCASGTDALVISLMAFGLKKEDAVFVPSFTFYASAESIVLAGGTPVFVDCDNSYNIDTENLEEKIKGVLKVGSFNPKGIIAVDLFGQAADYDKVVAIAKKYNLFLLEDAAQGFGGLYRGRLACSFGDVSATSFFPAKPLGCYGDGGAIFTDDDDLAVKIKSIRIHGMGKNRYDNIRVGLNGRMDTLQAAILLPKLSIFNDELDKRNKIAEKYTEKLKDLFITPFVPEYKTSSWAQFSLLASDFEQREMIVNEMKKYDIPIMIYYPIPMHLQTAFQYLGYGVGDLPRCEDVASRIFSIPMHPYLTDGEVDYISDCLRSICK